MATFPPRLQIGLVVLLRYCQLFNNEAMDTLAPYYDIYDDPYTQANFVLAKRNESLPTGSQVPPRCLSSGGSWGDLLPLPGSEVPPWDPLARREGVSDEPAVLVDEAEG